MPHKLGRNDPCHCGNGKKYKKCHLPIEEAARLTVRSAPIHAPAARAQALRVQRLHQQGLGKPIISSEFKGGRIVAVGNRLAHSKKWRTFHDFLVPYLGTVMGKEWTQAELSKPFAERHPIAQWYDHLCRLQREVVREPGQVSEGQMTGAVAAFFHLAYDLYSLDHNTTVQERLIQRLKATDNNFWGALYETRVAGRLVRAGFRLAFEDESDRSSSHCEFVATHARTGRRFSVEAKRRLNERFRLGRLLNGALLKQVAHPRVVFIELDVPDDRKGVDEHGELRRARDSIRAFEGRIVRGAPLPPAYVFLTNDPWNHHLDSPWFRSTVLADGFQIPEFKPERVCTLRDLIEGRARHIEMHDLLKSMARHEGIPSTFDGSNPVAGGEPPLRVGDSLVVQDADGVERVATVTTAVVNESWRKACYGLAVENGTGGIKNIPLSDVQLAAWRRHPETYFGAVQHDGHFNDLLQLYDRMLESLADLSKSELLELMANAPDIERLRTLDQSTLASVRAERMAMAFWQQIEAKERQRMADASHAGESLAREE